MAQFILKGKAVRCLKRTTSSMGQIDYVLKFYNIPKADYEKLVTWVIGDLDDEESLVQAMQGVVELYHCAADVGMGGVDEERMMRVNVEGTERVVRAAKTAKVSYLCYMSSIAALGAEEYGVPVSENSPYDKASFHATYALSKRKAEEIVTAAIDNNMKTVIVNPGAILGVSAHDASSAKIIFFAKKGIPFSTNGGTGYVDVRDVCRVMMQLVEKGVHGERFVLVGFNASNHELLAALSDGFGNKPPKPMPKWVMMTAATINEFIAKCLGKKTALTRSFARTALNRTWYDNTKVVETLDYEFISLKQCARDISQFMK